MAHYKRTLDDTLQKNLREETTSSNRVVIGFLVNLLIIKFNITFNMITFLITFIAKVTMHYFIKATVRKHR